MRLLELKSGRPWQFKYVEDPRQIHYAVLSHVWNKPTDGSRYVQEITYVEINPGSDLEKLSRFCRVAWDDGFTLVWADMCCIDKSSSAELAEAISSMYSWYRHANVCYAYLKDVLADFDSGYPGPESSLISSNWFTRGWTLQELIAPPVLVFLSTDWRPLGTKALLANHINFRTSIPSKILTHEQHIHEISVAQRLSWAADRNTTKVEDQAYCLMGLFGIHIPVIYGEGSYAFVRLQEEILRRIPDPTLLAWGPYGDTATRYSSSDVKEFPQSA
ncbi:heterokaryon incompatibility protein-domain-containing protein [Trametes meyenii]|nr:heterokaryon incompatibility protein-domain-containing protein [Trametes meyenii]